MEASTELRAKGEKGAWRDNASCLKAVFREFVARVMAGVEPGFRSVDGTKVRASVV